MALMLAKPLARLAAAVVLVLVVIGVWFALQAYPIGGSGKEEFVIVNYGDSLSTIASEMHAKGIIASSFAFRLDLQLFGSPSVIPGTYGMRQGASFSTLRRILSNEPNVVSVPPGYTLHEIALEVATHTSNSFADAFVKDESSLAGSSRFGVHSSLEGLVGPVDYVINPGESPEQLLLAMTQSFDALAAKVGLRPSTSIDGLDAYQLLTAASIVEKEGYYPSNMPKVARVIYNRLARGGPLQMDATVLYYFNQDGGTVTHAMLETPTPYNTYLNTGLTPTPICTVSTFSLNAMLHAPAGPWLYFEVIDKNGDEAFSTTFAQQLANEQLAALRGLS